MAEHSGARFRARLTVKLEARRTEIDAERIRAALARRVETAMPNGPADAAIRLLEVEGVELLDWDSADAESHPSGQSFFDTTPSLDELAKRQGVQPASFESLLGDFWPEDEDVDFVAAVRAWRRDEI